METKRLELSACEFKFSDGEARSFTGYAAVFNGVDSYGDSILPGAFRSVVGDGAWVKMYWNHGWMRNEMPIGRMFVAEDAKGLQVKEASFTPKLARADEVYHSMANGSVDGLSIGYKVDPSKVRKNKFGGRDIANFKMLKEVSVVDYPADSAALVDGVKNAIDEAETLKEIESLLRDAAGFSRTDACALVTRIKSLAHGDRAAESAVDHKQVVSLIQRIRVPTFTI